MKVSLSTGPPTPRSQGVRKETVSLGSDRLVFLGRQRVETLCQCLQELSANGQSDRIQEHCVNNHREVRSQIAAVQK